MTFFCVFSMPFGIDDSVATDYLCRQKKAMKMESTKQIRSIRSIRGQKNKRLTEREAWLTLKMGVSGVSGVPSVSGVSGVSGVPHPYSLPFREGPGVGFSLSPSAKRG
ncbi:MAG: hypothetical protein PUE05_05615 [bacterium]|nr:hypothetical protein [bacterium]